MNPNDMRSLMSPSISSRRVLVVDDDRDLREAMMDFLRTLGHAVIGACNAKQAIQIATTDAPEVAFIDVALPNGSGVALARTLRALIAPSCVQLIALTGLNAGASGDRAVDEAFDRFIVKPCSADRIAAVLNAIAVSNSGAASNQLPLGAGIGLSSSAARDRIATPIDPTRAIVAELSGAPCDSRLAAHEREAARNRGKS
jgi:DNA-binding response OmpR family regulator